MATTFEWVAPAAIATALDTVLNSLANATFSSASSTITNETGSPGLYPYIDLELVLGSLSPSTGAYVDIWLYPTLDASNFADASKPLQTSALLYTFQLDTASSTAQRVIARNLIIPPLDFKLAIRNQSGVQLSGIGATPNTLKYRRHYEQGV